MGWGIFKKWIGALSIRKTPPVPYKPTEPKPTPTPQPKGKPDDITVGPK